jgi:hypothetical protein
LNFFPPNLGTVGDEHGVRFHQDISTMENKYAGNFLQNMLADCCRSLTEEVSIDGHKGMSFGKKF